MTARNSPLDALRGGVALLVVIYHLVASLKLPMPRWLDVTGLMAVDAFFALSGYALARVYWNTDFTQLRALARYAAKRLLRIVPLLFVATIAVGGTRYFVACIAVLIAAGIMFRGRPRLAAALQASVIVGLLGWLIVARDLRALPTASLVWGFRDPSLSIAGGSWSIGVELVFYTLLPILLLVSRDRGRFLWAAAAIAVIVGTAYQVLHPTTLLPSDAPLALINEQWRAYVSPLNHGYFFVAGMLIFQHQRSWLLGKARWGLLAVGLLVYLGLAGIAAPDHGWGRATYSIVTIAITAAVASMEAVRLRPSVRTAFGWLGEISYGVYLLHFPVHSIINPQGDLFPSLQLELAFTMGAVVLVAFVTNRWVERVFGGVLVPAQEPRAAALPASAVKA